MTRFYLILTDAPLEPLSLGSEKTTDGTILNFFQFSVSEDETLYRLKDIDDIFSGQDGNPKAEELKGMYRYEITLASRQGLLKLAKEYLKNNERIYYLKLLYGGKDGELFHPVSEMEEVLVDVNEALVESLTEREANNYLFYHFKFYTLYRFVDNERSRNTM